MPTQTVPAVLYAAKSTQDKHKSIPTQLDDCRDLAKREGWKVAGEFHDEGFSAYSGNRGPGLRDATATAERAASEAGRECMLAVQHSDRLARGAGDAPGASDSLVEVWTRLRRQNVHVRSVQNDAMMGDVVLGAVASKQATEDSERKSKAIRDGKRRRAAERGESNGPPPFGYRFKDPAAKV
jgi:DNA invertase Pin-like site-specific DNA recombinase